MVKTSAEEWRQWPSYGGFGLHFSNGRHVGRESAVSICMACTPGGMRLHFASISGTQRHRKADDESRLAAIAERHRAAVTCC